MVPVVRAMNDSDQRCEPHRIDLFLRQQLSDLEQAELELHLTECVECRLLLERSAAKADIWSDVRESLRTGQQFEEAPHALSILPSDETAISTTPVLKLLTPTDDDRMIGRLGVYEIVGVIGAGGMGVVLKGFEAALNRYVAIKVLAPHLGSSGASRKRFAREAQAAASVVHDNVIEIYGVADTNGLPYLVMPYVPGPSLQKRLDEHGPLEVIEILRIGMQAALGLSAAHSQGLVHRDVKPANILLSDGVERLKLTDFGLARAADDVSLTKPGIIAGTPQYMSPEQASGKSIDQSSDLFGLGSVMYAMCTGRPPFSAESSYGVLRRITDTEPRSIRAVNPEIPKWLCDITEKLMSKRPENRFTSATEVADVLGQWLAHVQQPDVVVRPAPIRPVSPLSGGWIAPLGAALVVFVAIIASTSQSPLREDRSATGLGMDYLDADLSTVPDSFEHDFAAAGLPTNRFAAYDRANRASPSHVERVAHGIRVKRPGAIGRFSAHSIVPRSKICGDFDIVVSFQQLEPITRSETDRTECAVILAATLDDVAQTRLDLRYRHARTTELSNSRAESSFTQTDAERGGCGTIKFDSDAGTLRISRRGKKVYFLISADDSSYFRLVGEKAISDANLQPDGIQLRTQTLGLGATKVVWTKLTIRATEIVASNEGSIGL